MSFPAAGRRLAIFVEGDRRRGLGHVVRCAGYARRWREAGGAVRWVLDGDDAAFEVARPADEVARTRWQSAAADLPLGGVDAAIVDSYEAPFETYAAIAAAAPALYLDDLERLAYPPGLVVHSAPGPVSPPPGPARWATGPGWQSLRDPFRGAPLRRDARESVARLLVLTGGSDLRGLAGRLPELARRAFPDAEIDLVVGAGAASAPAARATRVRRAVDAEEMRDLMSAADLAVTAAGQTTYELARCGTPMALVAVAENQRKHFVEWPKTGAAVPAAWWDDPDFDHRVLWALATLSPPEARLAAARAGQALVDGRGADRAVAYLLGEAARTTSGA